MPDDAPQQASEPQDERPYRFGWVVQAAYDGYLSSTEIGRFLLEVCLIERPAPPSTPEEFGMAYFADVMRLPRHRPVARLQRQVVLPLTLVLKGLQRDSGRPDEDDWAPEPVQFEFAGAELAINRVVVRGDSLVIALDAFHIEDGEAQRIITAAETEGWVRVKPATQ